MHVLITGHRGYVGSVLVPMLVASGHTVVGLDSNLFAGSSFGPATPMTGVESRSLDIREVTREDLAGFDAVIHLAGLCNDPLGELNPALTFAINQHATVRLAELAKSAGVQRFLFASSCSVYGAASQEWLDETSPVNPVTAYGHSKWRAERELMELADREFSPVYLRCGTVYGVSSALRFDLVLNNLAAWAYAAGRVLLKSDGMAWRPLVHVEDAARAYLAALTAPQPQVHNQVFNVGRTADNYRVRELAQVVVEAVSGSAIAYADGASSDRRTYRVNCDKVACMLPQFRPQWDVCRGAAELVAAFQRVGLLVDEFEGPRYRRVDHLVQLMAAGKVDEMLRWRQAVAAP